MLFHDHFIVRGGSRSRMRLPLNSHFRLIQARARCSKTPKISISMTSAKMANSDVVAMPETPRSPSSSLATPKAKQKTSTKKTKKRLQKHHDKRVKLANKMNKKLEAFDDWFEGLNPTQSTDDSSRCLDDDSFVHDEEPNQQQEVGETSPRRPVPPRGGELEQLFASPTIATKAKCPLPPSPRADVLSPEQRQKARAVLEKQKTSRKRDGSNRKQSVASQLGKHLDASGERLENGESTDHTASTVEESISSSETAARDENDPKLKDLYGSSRASDGEKSSTSRRRDSLGSSSLHKDRSDEGLSSGSTHGSRSRGASSHNRVYQRASTTSSTAQAMLGLKSPGATQRKPRMSRVVGQDPLSHGGSEHSRRSRSKSDSLSRGGSEHCRSSSRNLANHDLSRGSDHRRSCSTSASTRNLLPRGSDHRRSSSTSASSRNLLPRGSGHSNAASVGGSTRNLLPRGSGHSTASSLNGSTHHERPQIPMTPTSCKKTPALQKRLLEKQQQKQLLQELPWSSPLGSSDHDAKKSVGMTMVQKIGDGNTYSLPPKFQILLSPSKVERKEKLLESYQQAKMKKLSPMQQTRETPTTPRLSLLQQREHLKNQRQQSIALRGRISDSLEALTGPFNGDDDFFGSDPFETYAFETNF